MYNSFSLQTVSFVEGILTVFFFFGKFQFSNVACSLYPLLWNSNFVDRKRLFSFENQWKVKWRWKERKEKSLWMTTAHSHLIWFFFWNSPCKPMWTEFKCVLVLQAIDLFSTLWTYCVCTLVLFVLFNIKNNVFCINFSQCRGKLFFFFPKINAKDELVCKKCS